MYKKLLLACLLIFSAPKVFSADVQLFAFLKIYPSPASDILNIVNDTPIKKVVIVNMVGQVVYQQEFNDVNITINISSFPPGMYYAQMDNTVAKRFIKE
jgi:hypothetical protein